MKLLASLDRRDQRLLLLTAVLALCTTVLLVLVHPQEQEDNYIPSTYSTTPHGAKAAYLLLAHLGYRVGRNEGPLDSIADTADVRTVLVLAEPTRAPSQQEAAAVRRVLVDSVAVQDSPQVQCALIDLLVEVNDRDSVPALRKLAQDTQVDEVVRQRATLAIRKLEVTR